MKQVVLVYSGGLDTSICIPFMKEEFGYEKIVTVTVDVGQPPVDPVVQIGEPRVIDAKLVQQRSVDVITIGGLVDGFV